MDLRQAVLVGDSVKDVQTAAAVGMPAIMVLSGLGRITNIVRRPFPCRFAIDLSHATRLILNGEFLPTAELTNDLIRAPNF